MANETLAASLNNVQQDVWLDMFYKGLDNPRPGMLLAMQHDIGTAANGDVVRFPIIPQGTATKAADSAGTTFTEVAPADAQATAFELHYAVSLSNLASATSPIKTVEQLGQTAVAALLDGLSKEIVAVAKADATAPYGTTTTDIGTDLTYFNNARKTLGAYQSLLAGWILTPELHNLATSNMTNAAAYGGREIIVDGVASPMLFGGPAIQDPNPTVDTGVLVVKGGLHYAILQPPTLRVAYNPAKRADEAVWTIVAAAKSVAMGGKGNVQLIHDQDDDGVAG